MGALTYMMTVKYSNVNQAYFLMFGDSVIEVFNSKSDLMNHLRVSGLKLTHGGKVAKKR